MKSKKYPIKPNQADVVAETSNEKPLLTTEEMEKILAEVRIFRSVPDMAQTLADASVFVGVPIGVVKAARRMGCLAFVRSGRIRLFELAEWLEEHHECWMMAGLEAPPSDWTATPSWDVPPPSATPVR